MRFTFPSFATALAVAALTLALDAAATPPKTLSYQGFLTTASDTPIDAPVQMTFTLYNVPTGGVALWTETQPSVTVAKGEFSTILGNVTPLSLSFDVPYYLGVKVGADPEMVPRQPLAASAYAFRALSIDSAATVPGTLLSGAITTATIGGSQVTGPITTATIPGSQVTGDLSGASNIDLAVSTATTGNIVKNGVVFLHDFGSGNVFLGEPSGNFTMTGTNNTGLGDNTLVANTTGGRNTAVGLKALTSNTTGSENTAVGVLSLPFNTTGTQNTSVGDSTLFFNTTGGDNTALGASALANNTTGGSGTAVGAGALFNNTTAGKNTAVGGLALTAQSFSNGGVAWDSMNTAVGYNALAANQPTTTTNGVNNTAVGALTLTNNTTGLDNTAVGQGALSANTVGQFNTAVGMQVLLHNTTGQLNTAMGLNALNSNTTGSGSIAIGNQSQFSNQTASFNTAVGNGTLNFNTSGSDNVVVGSNVLFNMTSGSFNTAMGDAAMFQNISGGQNTAIGGAALNAATGNSNTALGYSAGSNVTSGSNNIEIGNLGLAADNNAIRIGTIGTQTTAFMAGVRGVTTVGGAIPVLVDTNGQLGTTSSSRTVKEDIADMGDASAVLARLRPVVFRYKDRPEWTRQYGLIAEDVAEVAPDLAARSQDGVIETVYYQFLAPMLLNEYQKQLRVNTEQRARLEVLEHEVALMKKKLGLD